MEVREAKIEGHTPHIPLLYNCGKGIDEWKVLLYGDLGFLFLRWLNTVKDHTTNPGGDTTIPTGETWFGEVIIEIYDVHTWCEYQIFPIKEILII